MTEEHDVNPTPAEHGETPAPAGTSARTPLSVVLAGGGTAGHISPMIAIADAVRRLRPDASITMVGTPAGMETRLVPEAGYLLKTIDRVPMPRRPSADLLRLPRRFTRAVAQAEDILRAARADVVVGVGGYVCTPMYAAARKLGVPIVIHEANAKPGLANRVGSALGGSVHVAFESTPVKGAEHVGMPMRREISQLDRSSARAGARAALGIPQDARLLVVTGGSSGAASINQAVSELVQDRGSGGEGSENTLILHITGRGKEIRDGSGELLQAPGYLQRDYVDGMQVAYSAADLILARSGAGTVCELAATGTPAVLVPLPHGNGEQALNARDLVEAGGAVIISDAEVTAARLAQEVLPLLENEERLQAMSAAALSVGIRDADERMAARVLSAATPFGHATGKKS